jgi:simple sugar transport system permease protein
VQSIGVTNGRYLFDAIPYVVTLGIMIATSSNNKQMVGIPAELTRAR